MAEKDNSNSANPWETEGEGTEPSSLNVEVAPDMPTLPGPLPPSDKAPSPVEFAPRAYLALVSSDKHDWGMVEDTMGNLLWVPGKGEIVGSWSRPQYDNLIHISLSTPINALVDRAIQTNKRYAEERLMKELGIKTPKVPRVKKTKEGKGAGTEEVELPVDTTQAMVKVSLEINSLRARLGK